MPMNPRTLRPSATGFTPRSISGLALWLDAADTQTLYTTDAGNVTAVSAPTEISGCVGWWDASDTSSITQSGGLVSQWNDKSGNGNHATASGTARPTHTAGGLNGLSVMTFDGTANSMAVAANAAFNSNDLTYFIVFRASSDANKGVYTKISPSAGTSGFAIVTRAASPFVWLLAKNSSQPQVLQLSGVSPATQARIYSVTSSSAASGFVDGLSASSASSTADHSLNQTVRIGSREGSEFFGGYIAEIIHFSAALSSSDRARIERYLAAKWGISGVHTPATATNDPVGAWLDKSGNQRHATQATGANRPTVSATAVNARKALGFNGTTSRLALPSMDSTPSTVIAVARHNSGTSSAGRTPLCIMDGANYMSWQFQQTGTVRAGVTYNAAQNHFTASGLDPQGSVLLLTGQMSAGGGGLIGRLNGAALPGTDTVAYADGAQSRIGCRFRNADDLFWSGEVCEVLHYQSAMSLSQVQRIERYLASKWGITLAPQVNNADAQDWINRVYANGGTVSATTASAVNTFCNAIDAAGIRDRFYRLNLFCGNSDASLAAVRTPLFRGPSLSGTQFGNTIDTNASFVQGDYAEDNGLLGNSTTKWLNTGFTADTAGLTAASFHMSAVWPSYSHPANALYFPIAIINAAANIRYWLAASSSTAPTTEVATFLGASGTNGAAKQIAATNGATMPGGLWLASRTSTTSLRLYNGATEQASNTSLLPDATMSTLPMGVFARWNGTSTFGHSAMRLRGYSVGLGLTAQQVSDFNSAMTTFQTALGRA